MTPKNILKLLLTLLILTSCSENKEFDILILNGEIYDGSMNKSVFTDIGINGNTIMKIGDLSNANAKRTIDAKGLVVAPGFIDMHAHLDPILELSDCESHIRQGVTTALGGPDGSSPWPLGQFLDSLDQIGVGMNVAYLIGHNTIRKNVMALENRAPTEKELQQMKDQILQSMEEGAYGISTGLKYVPGAFSEVDEVISLSKIASSKGGIYTSHLREEGLGIFSAIDEAIHYYFERSGYSCGANTS